MEAYLRIESANGAKMATPHPKKSANSLKIGSSNKNNGPLVYPTGKPAATYQEWDPRYPSIFRHFLSEISILPEFLSIDHIGSTSVPGCGGKPILDLLALYQNE